MSRLRLAVVGDNCVDRFRAPFARSLIGGNAINVAVQLAMLGHESHYFGAVGRDADGERIRDLLAEKGVRVDHLHMREGSTAFTEIDVTASGERIFAFEEFGVCRGYQPTDDDLLALSTMDHVHIGWIADEGRTRRRLADGGISVSQDVSVNNAPIHLGVDRLRIAFGSAGEDRRKADTMAREFLAGGAQLAVVTRGSNGSMATSGSVFAETGISPVEIVDTTGAGDSFIAGFLYAYIERADLRESLACGRDCAARTCSHLGGFPQEPQPL
jgi:fructoselysine 6-kinase